LVSGGGGSVGVGEAGLGVVPHLGGGQRAHRQPRMAETG
jgi:hypothetical protein